MTPSPARLCLPLALLTLAGCAGDKAVDDTGRDDSDVDSADTGDTGDSGDSGDSGDTGETGDSAGAGAPQLEILLHNVDMEDRETNISGQDSRSHLIQSAAYLSGHDVVIFTDLYDHYVGTGVFGALGPEYGHRTNVVGEVTSGWSTTENFKEDYTRSGGVAILSTYDLDDATQHIFATTGCGPYVSANLGFAYVALDLDGQTAHLVATRLQPDHKDCADGEAASIRQAQLEELRAWVDAKDIPADEELIIAGSMDIDPGTPEYAAMIDTLGVIEPHIAGHDALFDPSQNNLAAMATAFSVGVPHHGDYVFVAAAHPHPDFWQNVGFDLRSREWWELEGFASAELSDTYPVLALAYADADTPTTSSHARLFDRLTLRSNLTGALLQASESVPDDPLTADGADGSSRAWFNLASYDEDRVDQACLGTGNIRAESGLWLAHFWNMDELRFLHPSYADAGTAIGMEVLGGGCLADGSSVALYAATADGTQYGRVGDDGFVNYVSTDVGDAETFTVTFDPTPPEDWTDELVYAP